jgi:hypothetical protein
VVGKREGGKVAMVGDEECAGGQRFDAIAPASASSTKGLSSAAQK